ncbi:hypothetical protein CPB85DRAFT_1212768, partial [Mucidula mucida]
YFLEQFKEHARQSSVDVSNDHENFVFNRVSSYDADTGAPNKNQWVFPWLFVRLRTRESQKWSGTNVHPLHNNNKLGNIMNAFAHFVYEASQNTIVLLTSRVSSTFNNKDILFNLMTHTETGNSVISDHGKAGIRTFIDTHGCVQRCISLGLEPFKSQGTKHNKNEKSNDDDDDELY